MPTVFSMSLRVNEPGVPMALLASGAAATLSLPMRSVRASAWFCSLLLAVTSPAFTRTWSARIISRGKSRFHSLWPGDVRAVDVAELAVEALVDDLVLLAGGEPGRVLVVVRVDEREQRRERRAELEAEPAAVAEVVDPGQLAAEVGLVEVLRVERVVGGGHRRASLLDGQAGRAEPGRPRARCPGPTVRAGSSRAQRRSQLMRLEALGEAAGVALLGPGQRLEPLGDLLEALVAGGLGEAGVHLGVLVGLTGDGRLEVVLGGADGHVGDRVADLGEEVEVAEGVAGLALGDRAEQRGDVGVALDVGLLGEVQVAAVGLALAGERLLQVLLGLAAVEFRHVWLLFAVVGLGGMGLVSRRPSAAQSAQTPRKTISVDSMLKPRRPADGHPHGRRVDVDVEHLAAPVAHQVVVGVEVGVEAGRAGAELELDELAHRGQVVERLVDGAQRDGRHLGADRRRRPPRPWGARGCRAAPGRCTGAAGSPSGPGPGTVR